MDQILFVVLIWKLIYCAKIWYPIEVAEVEIAATGGRQSGQDPDEKNSIKNLEIFELQKRYTPQKKAKNNSHSYLKQNQRLLYWKNWK